MFQRYTPHVKDTWIISSAWVDLQQHFKKFKWYIPSKKITKEIKLGRVLSKTDLHNIYMLKGLENEMNKENISVDLNTAGKKISHVYASSSEVYYLCKDKSARLNIEISEFKNHNRYGTWKRNNNKIEINWTKETGGIGVGPPLICGSVCDYKEYKPFENRISDGETLDLNEIVKDENDHWDMKNYMGSCR